VAVVSSAGNSERVNSLGGIHLTEPTRHPPGTFVRRGASRAGEFRSHECPVILYTVPFGYLRSDIGIDAAVPVVQHSQYGDRVFVFYDGRGNTFILGMVARNAALNSPLRNKSDFVSIISGWRVYSLSMTRRC